MSAHRQRAATNLICISENLVEGSYSARLGHIRHPRSRVRAKGTKKNSLILAQCDSRSPQIYPDVFGHVTTAPLSKMFVLTFHLIEQTHLSLRSLSLMSSLNSLHMRTSIQFRIFSLSLASSQRQPLVTLFFMITTPGLSACLLMRV
jgi:hypothetical protein